MTYKLFRYTGIAAVTILWMAVIVGMVRSGLKLFDDRPLSFIGVATDSALLFNVALGVSAVLFSLFGFYLYKTHSASRLFLGVFMIGQVAQIIAAFFVYEGSYKIVHTTSAFILAGAIPFYMKFFTQSLKAGKLQQTSRSFFQAEKIFFVVGIGAFVFTKGIAPIAEILPALPFHAWVIYLTFGSEKQAKPYSLGL